MMVTFQSQTHDSCAGGPRVLQRGHAGKFALICRRFAYFIPGYLERFSLEALT